MSSKKPNDFECVTSKRSEIDGGNAPQMKDSSIKATAESVAIIEVPLLVYDLERDVLVRGRCAESHNAKLGALGGLEHIGWSLGRIQQIGVKHLDCQQRNQRAKIVNGRTRRARG